MYRQVQPPIASPSTKPVDTATIIARLESLKTKLTNLIKAQESQVKESTNDPLQNQIDVFNLIKSVDSIIGEINGLLNGLKTIYDEQQLDSGIRIQIQVGLQQIGQLFKKSAQLHSGLIDKFKKINYDAVLPITINKSVLKLKGAYDKLVENFIKMVETYKKEGQTLRTILSDDALKSKFLEEFNKLQKVKQEYFRTYKETLYAFLNKINTQRKYIGAFCDYIKFLLNIQKKKLDVMYKKKKDEYDSIDLLKLIISVEMLEFDYGCYFDLLSNRVYNASLKEFEDEIKKVIIEIDNFLGQSYNTIDSFETCFNYPSLLSIEKHQIDCYNVKLLLFDIQNESMLWKNISEKTTALFERVKGLALKSIGKTYLLYRKYTETFPDATQRAEFLIRYNSGQLPLQKTSMLSFRSSTSSTDKAQRGPWHLD
jgi:hypothetical protein